MAVSTIEKYSFRFMFVKKFCCNLNIFKILLEAFTKHIKAVHPGGSTTHTHDIWFIN